MPVLKMASPAARRDILVSKLRKVDCELRDDSQLCREYIDGTGQLSLGQVIKKTREIQFFYKHTLYSSYLREQRYFEGDGNSYEARYWRRRDAVKDGVIGDFDDPSFDSDASDDGDFAYREEARRDKAKYLALKQWIKCVPEIMHVLNCCSTTKKVDEVLLKNAIATSPKASVLPDFMFPRLVGVLNSIKQSRRN